MDNPRYAYFDGEIVPIEQAKVSVMTHALNYGTGVFGGIRAYWNEDVEELYIFRVRDHFKRLIASAGLIRINIKETPEELTDILIKLLRTEGYHTNCYVRPLAYKSDERIGVKLHGLADSLTMFALPFGKYIQNDAGAHLCFSSWRRIDDNAIPARGKISGAYANSALIKSDAQLSGFDDALVLNEDGHISEASAANVFMVRDGVVITPPITANILEGITRKSIIQLMRDELGLEVVERNIDRTEIFLADEAFICGTGVQMAAITRIEHRPIGDGKMGPITEQTWSLLLDVLYGRVGKYRDWLTPVYVSESLIEK